MSILARLFGWFGAGASAASQANEIEHEGYRIRATPLREGGVFRLAAVISKHIDGVEKQHRMVRADTFSSADEACDAAIAKAKRLIAEQGDRIFS